MYRTQRRRSRFTATITARASREIVKEVILSYDAASVEAHYTRLGYRVLAVDRGDYRTQGRRQQRNSARAASPDGGYTYNLRAIREAFEAMTGMQLPGNLRLMWGKRNAHRLGSVFAYSDGRLILRIKPNLSREQANRTLWHELAHVAQYARMGDHRAWMAMKVPTNYGTSYLAHPIEREAREWEVLADTDDLLKEA